MPQASPEACSRPGRSDQTSSWPSSSRSGCRRRWQQAGYSGSAGRLATAAVPMARVPGRRRRGFRCGFPRGFPCQRGFRGGWFDAPLPSFSAFLLSDAPPPRPAAATGDERDAGPRDAVGAPGVPASATPWAGTDTAWDGGEDRSVPLPGDRVRAAADRRRRQGGSGCAARCDPGRQDGSDVRRQSTPAHGTGARGRRPHGPAAYGYPQARRTGHAGHAASSCRPRIPRHASFWTAGRVRATAGPGRAPGTPPPSPSAARCSAGLASARWARVRVPAGRPPSRRHRGPAAAERR